MTSQYLGSPTLNNGWDLLPVPGETVESLGDQHLVWWEGPGSKHFMKSGETALVVEGEDGCRLQKASGEESEEGKFATSESWLFRKKYSSARAAR